MGPVLLVVGACIVLALVVVPWYLRAKRRDDIAAVAARQGLHYSAVDPFACVRIPFPLFRRGDGRGVENIVWHDRPDTLVTRAFDYWFYDEHRDSTGRGTRSYTRFSCVLAQVDGSWPDLSITRDGFLEKALDLVGWGSIELESDEFNRRFALRSPDRRFAITVCDASMIDFLLTTEARFSFAIKGRWVLLACDPVEPTLVPAVMRVAEAFVGHIPRVVYELWPSPFRDAQGRPLPAGDEGLGYAPPAVANDMDEPEGPQFDLDGDLLPEVVEDPWGEHPRSLPD